MTTLAESFRELASIPSDAKSLDPLAPREREPHIFQGANTTSLAVTKAFDHLQTYAGREPIDWVYDCVTLITEALASAEWHFERAGKLYAVERRPEDSKADVSEAPDDLVNLFSNPNPYMTWSDFVTLLTIDWLLIGNSFWHRFKPSDGKPAALYRLMPQYLQVVPGKTQLIDGYEYRVPGRGEPIKFAPEEVIHFKRPNPHSEYLGAGVVKGGARMFDMEIALTQSQSAYFQRGTRLSGVLESDRSVPRDVWNRTKAQFMAMYSGGPNSYKVAMLSHGMQFKPIQANAAEAEFRFLTGISRDRVLAMFRVPPPLLGVTGGFDRQAVKEAQRIFDNKTVRPIADRLQEIISLAITSAWDFEFKIDYEYKMPVEDQLDLAVSVATLPGVQVKEVREAAGFKPLGQDRKGPDGKPIDEIVLNLPGENDNASQVKDRNLGNEPGRPPDPAHTAAFPQAPAAMPRDAAVRQAQKSFARAEETLARATKALESAGV